MFTMPNTSSPGLNRVAWVPHFSTTPEKVPAQCVRQAVVLHGRILAGPDLEVDGIDADRAYGALAGVRERRLDIVGLKDLLPAEAMDTHFRDQCREPSPWIANQLQY
jgi:hypothetical protein